MSKLYLKTKYNYIYNMVSYFSVIKADEERYLKEKERVKNIINEKYKNDEEYREKCKERSRLYRLKKKNDLKVFNNEK